AMTFNSTVNPFSVTAPTLKEFGQIKTSTDSINKNNSNIIAILSNTPKYLAFEATGQTNPSGPGTYNFITDTSQIHLNFEMNLPLSFKTSSISKDSIFDFDFEKDFSDNDKINNLLFHLEAANSLPLDVSMQVYFLDNAYHVVDSMFTTANLPQIVAGTTDVNGKVTAATSKTVEVTYDKARINKMKNVKYARIFATLITANKGQQFVKVYSQNGIIFKLGVQAQIQYTDNL
ncbi:MAG: hypothetical protein Q8910_05955, partial [Bacteroidota bacterium]|nr:hypothetical protein [Bacteroidota bacterium]MDP4225906.1 hypothetical protein [Bacteroidota bacterium]